MRARSWLEYLAHDEWGNDVMQRVASERFAADPTLDRVEVHEHAGWFLTFTRDGHIVDTANDMAQLRPEAIADCRRFDGLDIVGCTRRDEGVDRKWPKYYPCIREVAA